MKTIHCFYFFLAMISLPVCSQTAIVEGFIKNVKGDPIEEVSVMYQNTGTISDKNGFYSLKIKAAEEVEILFSHLTYHSISKKITVPKDRTFRYSPQLQLKTEAIKEVNIRNQKRPSKNMTALTVEKAKRIPGANAGVENILKTLPGVNSSNELSTQYQVRGGNFDENLVYVNGIEVYRPFLVRSGQQEGLSFVNVDMIQQIQFSAGGFQAKYDDKLSSVLDITYKKPTNFSSTIDVSLLGINATFEEVFLQKKLAVLTGIRYRDNSLLVSKVDVKSHFKPQFTDIQSLINYDISPQFSLQFLGNIAINQYDLQPLSRRTKFGTLANPLELIVNYEGRENNRYQTYFGALNAIYQLNENTKLQLTNSNYNTQESEYFDILAQYNIGEVETDLSTNNFGNTTFTDAIGSQLNHARNDYDALIQQLYFKGNYSKKNTVLEWGLKYQIEQIKDKTKEWEMIDSLGFAVRPLSHNPNNEPYTAFEGPIVPFNYINTFNEIDLQRWNGFVQWSQSFEWKQFHWWINVGNRFHYWKIKQPNSHHYTDVVYSPRLQLAFKPIANENLLYRISGGWYHQPPSYKELKGFDGNVNKKVKAQQSIHLVLGNEYVFKWFERPFKLISELYFKDLSYVNTYTLDNVRIRYVANNNAEAYVYGLDVRLNGEFVPGTESWVSFGYLKTEENTNQRGFIPRPTDQRLKFGILFQDYVPNIPNLKMYLNLIYNTGVPGGSPSYADPYLFQNRLSDYKRADLGILYILKDDTQAKDRVWLQKIEEISVGFEIFNMFDVQNSITNTWVRDSYSKQSYGIPNYMSGRIFNLRLMLKI